MCQQLTVEYLNERIEILQWKAWHKLNFIKQFCSLKGHHTSYVCFLIGAGPVAAGNSKGFAIFTVLVDWSRNIRSIFWAHFLFCNSVSCWLKSNRNVIPFLCVFVCIWMHWKKRYVSSRFFVVGSCVWWKLTYRVVQVLYTNVMFLKCWHVS